MRTAALAILMFLPLALWCTGREFYDVSDIYGMTVAEPNSIRMDDEGFVWVASKNGVFRFSDGMVRRYELPYKSMNVISVEVTAGGGKVAAYTNQGEIFIYNPMTDRFEFSLDLPKELKVKELYLPQVEFDEGGGMWIASSMGLYRKGLTDFEKVGGINGALGDLVTAAPGQLVAAGPEGIFLIGTATGKTSKLCGSESTFPTKLLPDDGLDRIWVGTMADGLYYADLQSGSLRKAEAPGFPRQYVRDIVMPDDSTLWCGIDGRGVWVLSRDGKSVKEICREDADNPASIGGNGIQEMLCDGKSRVWVCSYTGGISLTDLSPLRPERFIHRMDNPNSLVNNYVYDVAKDSIGQVWAGTNSGLSCLDIASGRWTNLFADAGEEPFMMHAVCCDRDGDMWVGSYSHGAYVIDSETKKIKAHYSMPDGILSKTGFVFSIFCDSEGYIWLGGMIGDILRFDPGNKTFRHYPQIPVTVMAQLDKDTMLLGCTNRLFALDIRSGSYRELLSGSLIRDIMVKDTVIWVATSGSGLIRIDSATGKIKRYDSTEGFPAYINSLMASGRDILLGSGAGLLLFNPEDSSLRECRLPLSSRGYDFTPGATASLGDGYTAWGTTYGLLVMAPELDTGEVRQGSIHLSDVLVSGKSLRINGGYTSDTPLDKIRSLTFAHNENNLTFVLESLGSASPQVMFSYKLEGYDSLWSAPSKVNSISLSNLKSGDYTLRVRLSAPGAAGERVIRFRIKPPFWETWWFRTVVTVILAVIAMLCFRTYVNRLNRRNAESKLNLLVSSAHDMRNVLKKIDVPEEVIYDTINHSDADDNESSLTVGNAKRHADAINDAFLKKAVETVTRNLDNPHFGKEEFASEMGVSTSLLFKKIKSISGMSVVVFIKEIRMDNAMRLLEDPTLSISDVADRCGFSTVGYFSTVFRKHFGKTPSECRK